MTVSLIVSVTVIVSVLGVVSEQIDGVVGNVGVTEVEVTGSINGIIWHLNPVLKKFIKLAKLTWILPDSIKTSFGPEVPQYFLKKLRIWYSLSYDSNFRGKFTS